MILIRGDLLDKVLGTSLANVFRICCGPFESLCYLIENKAEKNSLLIDAGCPAEDVVRLIEERGLKLEAILITHTHFDHLLGLGEIVRATNCRALAHPMDLEMLPLYWKEDFGTLPRIEPIEDGMRIKLGELSFLAIHTPGHTPGSTCYYSSEIGSVFTGDTLFKGAVGTLRYSGKPDYKQMRKSLRKLLSLPEDTSVFPGHGDPTTIGEERNTILSF
ncbi:MBL fold metallo-hydrolase [Candidatus Korarchaeum cryptofilum]|uniref:MBL fold metallo-hydrolase n=1 Tax=Candidatus Korarchaeum cryptofilum TaxID=498846 RepID=A0A3R9P9L3_9CREN|nr:MBL fold metallo-hydrolase [Candidatus Korarchaeum cryptofilum]RSN68038.1 MBL fold metallo-hydrolase [Candidatus Korarchaeum cryptofilum]